MPGSQIPKSLPDLAFSVSFPRLSWFEWRNISNGSNRNVCKAPSFQDAFATTVCSNRRCSQSGLLEEQLACLARQAKQLDGLTDGRQCGSLDILDPPKYTILLPAQRGSVPVEKHREG